MPGAFRLRPADSADIDFLFDLKREGYKEHVMATWGEWDEDWQRRRFRTGFDSASIEIITIDDRDVGALGVEWDRDPVFFVSIELLPGARRHGVGTEVIGYVLERARELGKGVCLQVLKVNNDARRLYERHGFTVSGYTETHVEMVWAPT